MKTTLFLGFGMFWVSGVPTRIQTLKKVCMIFLSEICISESTPPTATKRASQFRRPLLRRKGAQLNSTSHFPTPLQSEHGYDFVDQRTSSSGGGNSAAAQLRECNPFLCRTAAELRWQSGGGAMEEKGIVLPELSCRNAAELTPPDFSAPGGQPPEQPERFGGSSAPGVHSQSCRSCLVWPPS
jgi:hypothetical protein